MISKIKTLAASPKIESLVMSALAAYAVGQLVTLVQARQAQLVDLDREIAARTEAIRDTGRKLLMQAGQLGKLRAEMKAAEAQRAEVERAQAAAGIVGTAGWTISGASVFGPAEVVDEQPVDEPAPAPAS